MSQVTIAIQGQPASFHYQAAESFFSNQSLRIEGFDTFAEVFEALASQKADFGVVAVENSIHGAINESYDLLDQHNFWIQGELYLHIEQCLIALPGTTLEDITDVYTHFAALSQCRRFLDKNLPHTKRHVHPDTAGAVADIKSWGNPHKAAIASTYAATHYGLPVLARAIETNIHNYTRFALLGRAHSNPAHATKTTLLVQLESHTGALYQVLGVFASHDLNLSMLISRPVVGKPGRYQFYIDLDHAADSNLATAIKEIEALQCQARILGSYKPLNTLEALVNSK